MNTEVKNAINASALKVQYDEQAKRLLGNKIILAHILAMTVDEFRGMDPKEVVTYIEGEPLIGKIPVEPGLTNKEVGERIIGLNTENLELYEGLIRFDIIFYVRMKDGLSQMIINVEIQKDEPLAYAILNRAIFYTSRLISSQKGRDFVKSNYNDIKRVFSIWLCMGRETCSWDYIHLTRENLLGGQIWKGKLDLINIVMIGLPKVLPEKGEQYKLHRLLTALLSDRLSVNERLDIVRDEYRIEMEELSEKNAFGREMNDMCNLSEGIWEDGQKEGRDALIFNLDKVGIPLSQIAEAAQLSVEEIQGIIEARKQ